MLNYNKIGSELLQQNKRQKIEKINSILQSNAGKSLLETKFSKIKKCNGKIGNNDYGYNFNVINKEEQIILKFIILTFFEELSNNDITEIFEYLNPYGIWFKIFSDEDQLEPDVPVYLTPTLIIDIFELLFITKRNGEQWNIKDILKVQNDLNNGTFN
jgi:hypothetical protein